MGLVAGIVLLPQYAVVAFLWALLEAGADAWGHWITSSARSSSEGGIVRPRALAVALLRISSKRVGSSTGSSLERAPCRSLPA